MLGQGWEGWVQQGRGWELSGVQLQRRLAPLLPPFLPPGCLLVLRVVSVSPARHCMVVLVMAGVVRFCFHLSICLWSYLRTCCLIYLWWMRPSPPRR